MNQHYSVGILIFDQVEVLDFTGPYEVFSVTRFKGQSYDSEDRTPFQVDTISETGEQVECRHGLKVQPDRSFQTSGQYDILVIPGGLGVRWQVKNSKLLDWIRKQNEGTMLTTSVCTGSILLAEAGLLKGKKATTHHENLTKLASSYPEVTVVRDQKVVDEGNFITSAGISAGINMAFQVVERLFGAEISQQTQEFMEYNLKQ
ncbi:DJ-1/PfpI family protein [Natranaerobius thermophilus]|uniref:ThiJ/PfpI domain protein n=1 Tax=Natranaerobius thermophilus (strain ATCC BAA-1301 / DSM 18059 / JW/NM-WN-LF) TaxID=457570 RepID=B2A7M1_NATTJ|nr:DJ-1/PfpI family protein [Natranaerobius thermophilus]ACB85730.1 ThiJ/PfpI domain protein [Natranaerobius thermophilus JW/NM-WN-LF]